MTGKRWMKQQLVVMKRFNEKKLQIIYPHIYIHKTAAIKIYINKQTTRARKHGVFIHLKKIMVQQQKTMLE